MSKANDADNQKKHNASASHSRTGGHIPGFLFTESPGDFHDPAALVVRVPSGIHTSQELFNVFAEQLRFPSYFGQNWDALEECLRDLSWLPPTQPVAIVHEDLPFSSNDANRAIYLGVLRTVIDHWSARPERIARVIMPVALQAELNQAANKRR